MNTQPANPGADWYEARKNSDDVRVLLMVIRTMKENGWELFRIWDGEEWNTDLTETDACKICTNKICTNLDEYVVYFKKENVEACVFMVNGQYPDTISDWSISIDSIMSALAELIDM